MLCDCGQAESQKGAFGLGTNPSPALATPTGATWLPDAGRGAGLPFPRSAVARTG